MENSKNVLITGGAGFIGSHVVRLFVNKYPHYHIFNLDSLTYAGNLNNLKDVETAANYTFIKGDITDGSVMKALFKEYQFDVVLHLAAESHVDRSIKDPLAFAKTNIIGTMVLLNEALALWNGDFKGKLFYHISTDEVYGTLGKEGLFTETTAYDPNSPYSASKASSDHFVRAYGETYGLPYIISNCSNNYGPNQFPEKLIPLFINNILEEKSLPVYGDGLYTRDWLYVLDHAKAIDVIAHQGTLGETYNIGGHNEWTNIDLISLLCERMSLALSRKRNFKKSTEDIKELITFIKDRPGHDRRYAIDATKLKDELGWVPSVTFEEGLAETIDWYLDNGKWLNEVLDGSYASYYAAQYK